MGFVAADVRRLGSSLCAGIAFAVWKFEPSYVGCGEKF
jgi:hypothetical protein